MASQGARLRPFTFFARLPRGVTNVDLCKIMVQRFTRSELRGVQDFTGGKFEVVFATKAAVDRFIADPVVEIQDQKVRFEYRGSRVKVVRVFHYPVEDSEEELKRVLGAYGQVYAIQRESVPGFPETNSGTRRVRMEMLRDVPNILQVQDRVVRCEYEGVVRQCIRCGGTGHHAAACTTPKCKRCDQFGHEDCDAPCSNCQADHARSACKVRSFAWVVGQASTNSTASASENSGPTSEPEAKSASDAANNPDADSRDSLDSAPGKEEVSAPEPAKNVAGAAAITAALAPAAVEEAAEVAPPLVVEEKPSEPADDGTCSVAPSVVTPKKPRKRRGKRKLFAEEKQAVSKTGLRKASDSEEDTPTLSSTHSPARQKRAVTPTKDSPDSDEEFSSNTDEEQMEDLEQDP